MKLNTGIILVLSSLALMQFVRGDRQFKDDTITQVEHGKYIAIAADQLEVILARLEAAERHIEVLEKSNNEILAATWDLLDISRNGNLQRLKRDVRVALTASLTTNPPGLHTGQTVVFDKIDINLGSGYDNTTGVYTCPVDGNYVFTASIAHMGDTRTEIVFEGNAIAAMGAQGTPTDIQQSSNSAVVHCLIGQRVWVRVATGSRILGSTSPITQFASNLLWED